MPPAKAGLKASGRPDFALIVADAPASAAAAFTSNRVIAAPLIIDKENLSATGGHVRVVAINAGNANCAAGEAGLEAARATCAAAARTFDCRAEEVFPSSTGSHRRSAARGKAGRGAARSCRVARRRRRATSTMPPAPFSLRTPWRRSPSPGSNWPASDGAVREVRIAAFGKGSGMIHPQLVPHATMLVYVMTDAAIEPADLNAYLRPAIEVSFNRISVDGDTSTNDTVLLLASGASGVAHRSG